MKKRILRILLAFVMVVGLVPTAYAAAETTGAAVDLPVTIGTDQSVTLKDSNGNGYYEIGTADELYAFAAAVNNGGGNTAINGELTADIVVNTNVLVNGVLNTDTTVVSGFSAWTPIGTSSTSYTGSFNGNNYTVSGLYYSSSSAYCVGLFGCVGTDGTVCNVGVVASYLRGSKYVGGVVGINRGGTVNNCHNTGAVSGGSDVGGVVGNNVKALIYDSDGNSYYSIGTVQNCYNTGTVTGTGGGTSSNYGGVVGCNNGGTVENCYNTGTVTGKVNNVGGVVGWNAEGAVKKCYNTGAVSCTESGYVGGVAGINGNTGTTGTTGTVQNCYNTGTVTPKDYRSGGVVGRNNVGSTVTNCYYLAGCATDSNDFVQNGIGAMKEGEATPDVPGSTTGKTDEQFASGEVAYLLNGDQDTITFCQTLTGDNVQATPAFGDDRVYRGYRSPSCAPVYTNDPDTVSAERPAHDFSTGDQCSVCGAFKITVDDITGGTITADKTGAEAGETVTLAVTASAGYEIGIVKYNDAEIRAVDGGYSFTMPEGSVTVSATFDPVLLVGGVKVTAENANDVLGGKVQYVVVEDEYGNSKLTLVLNEAEINHSTGAGIWTMGDLVIKGTGTITGSDYGIFIGGSLEISEGTTIALSGGTAAVAIGGGFGKTDTIITEPETADEGSIEIREDENEDPKYYTTYGAYVWDENAGEYVFTPAKAVEFEPGYLVTFDVGDSEDYIESQEVVKDGTAEKPTTDPTLSGYTFGGWYTSQDNGETLDAAYDFSTPVTDDVTLYAKWVRNASSSTSGFEPTYRPTIDATEGGDVSVSDKTPEKGDKVTITTDPDKGYEVGKITVTDSMGNKVDVTDNGDGTYSFVQPAGKVTITVTYVPTGSGFTDVSKDSYYYDAVNWAVAHGITSGTGNGTTFSPDAVCTRAQAVTFLWRSAGAPEPETAVSPFEDVAPSAYYYKAVLWAAENGITGGTSAVTFSPDATVTRGQIVTFLWRMAGSPAAVQTVSFRDVAADAYYHNAVIWAADKAITSGTGDGTTFSPDDPCLRSQIVTFLYRCCKA